MQETTALQVEKKELSNALAKYAENPNTVLPKRHCTGKQKVIENKGDHCIAGEECWKVLERPGIWQEKQYSKMETDRSIPMLHKKRRG